MLLLKAGSLPKFRVGSLIIWYKLFCIKIFDNLFTTSLCACGKFNLLHLTLKSPNNTIRSGHVSLAFSMELSNDTRNEF